MSCPGHEIGWATLKTRTSVAATSDLIFYFQIPQHDYYFLILISLLLSRNLLVWLSVWPPLFHPFFLFSPVSVHYSLLLRESALRLSRPRVEPVPSPHPSLMHPSPPFIASHNMMKSGLDRLINNARRLKHTSSRSPEFFLFEDIFLSFHTSSVWLCIPNKRLAVYQPSASFYHLHFLLINVTSSRAASLKQTDAKGKKEQRGQTKCPLLQPQYNAASEGWKEEESRMTVQWSYPDLWLFQCLPLSVPNTTDLTTSVSTSRVHCSSVKHQVKFLCARCFLSSEEASDEADKGLWRRWDLECPHEVSEWDVLFV